MKNKKRKIFEKVIIICVAIILVEVIGMAIMKIVREKNVNRINSLNDMIKQEDGYVAVGISDFHQSKTIDEKYYQYTNSTTNKSQNIIATQARIVKYDKNMNIVWENTYPGKYDSTFYNIIEVEDGYIAVGSFVEEYKQIEANTRTAMIVKYNKNGKKVWDKTYHVLSDTEFYKVIQDGEDFIVIGQSIYENMEMGTHITGGGIIVRYSSDGEELAHNNYGGNKSGSFNDIVKVDDGYIVCGKDATNYGIVLKFKKDFNREADDTGLITKKLAWQRTYANTDTTGFSSMVLVDNKIYAVGALNVSNEKDDEGNTLFKYNDGLVIYNKDGKYIGKYVMEDEVHHAFNNVVTDGTYFYLATQLDVDSYYDGGVRKSMVVKYDIKEEKEVQKIVFDSTNDFLVNRLIEMDKKYMMVGTSNDKCGFLGCDYYDLHEYVQGLKTNE